MGKCISMKLSTTARIGAAALAAGCALSAPGAAANDVSIVSNISGDQIVVSASADRFAGAIDSLTFRGVQYINTYDHGRELAVALQVDGLGECFNPTEPGSFDDASGPTSSSILQSISNAGNVLTTQTNMVNWLRPGEAGHSPCLGINPPVGVSPTYLSNYILSKTISVSGAAPNLFIDTVSIAVPDTHGSTNTEAATAYLPSSFSTFLNYDRTSRTLTRLVASATDPASNGLTPALYTPVIVATPNGANAMGVISPSTYDGSANKPYYDYFSFGGGAPTSKWSCVFGGGAVHPGSVLNYTCGIAVGSVDEVISAMNVYPGQPITQNIPIFRFYSASAHHFFTTSYDEGAGTAYSFETTAFHLFPAGTGSGYYPLYRCYNLSVGDHFISTQSTCEGFAQEGIYGYAAPTAAPGLYPLYRFSRGGATSDHLETINYAEGANNGYTYEGILGYVAS